MRILFLEPFFGGSHKAFAEGWRQNSRHEIEILGLPARRWKWRMSHSGFHFANLLNSRHKSDDFDLVVASSMLPLAQWKGFCSPGWAQIKTVLYFHENQLTYPVQDATRRPDYQYGFANILSTLAADRIWFNSDFHRRSFSTRQSPCFVVCRITKC